MSVQDRIDFTSDMARLLRYGRSLGFNMILNEVLRGKQQAEWNSTHCRVVINGVRCEREREWHEAMESRHPFKHIGIATSEHTRGFAGDIYIIVDNKISNDRELYARLGEHWEFINSANRWGGNFVGFPDLGHFERKS